MVRRSAFTRAVAGVIYLPLYYFILYPIVFFAGVVLTAIGIVLELITGREMETKSRVSSDAWEAISQPVTWIFSGNQSDKPSWIP